LSRRQRAWKASAGVMAWATAEGAVASEKVRPMALQPVERLVEMGELEVSGEREGMVMVEGLSTQMKAASRRLREVRSLA
jgi:hypothetical protein